MAKERLTIMIDPGLREQLQDMADRDCRSLGEMLSICVQAGIDIISQRLEAAESVLILRKD